MTEDALLAAVLAEPDDDAPRLIYADWLDENGQPERAEFIRVQCEAARMEESGEPCEIDPREGHTCFEHPCRICQSIARYDALCARARTLLTTMIPNVANGRRGRTQAMYSWAPRELQPLGAAWQFRRGFVESVRCSAADWLAHADAITARHPLAAVTLTTWPEVETMHGTRDGIDRSRIKGRPTWHEARGMASGEGHWMARLLNREWPRITFSLPPVREAAVYRLEGQIPPGGSAPAGSILLGPRESAVVPTVNDETAYITNTSTVNSLAVAMPYTPPLPTPARPRVIPEHVLETWR